MKDSQRDCCDKCKVIRDYDGGYVYYCSNGTCSCHTITEKITSADNSSGQKVINVPSVFGTTEKKWNCLYGGTCLHKTCERASITGKISPTTDTSDNWQERFDALIRHLTGATLDTPLISNASALQIFIAKEKERSWEGMFTEKLVNTLVNDSFEAGKEVMLASVREKIAGMKIKHERHPDDKTWCNYCGYNDAIRDALSTLE